MEKYEISRASLGRIPAYLNYLDSLDRDTVTISATAIAKALGLGEVQVRKDLALFCKSGKPKIGYPAEELQKDLRHALGCENGNAVLIGAGQLGRALLEYSGFEAYGTTVLAGFDTAVQEETHLPSGKSILPAGELETFCKAHDVRIGVITTPPASAQSVLDRLHACGVKLILCFAPVRLKAPADTVVQYVNLALSLAHLKTQSR